MASNTKGGGANRLSFAKIAAMPPPSKLESPIAHPEENGSQLTDPPTSPSAYHTSSTTLPPEQSVIQSKENSADRQIEGLGKAVKALGLTKGKNPEGSESSGDPQENGVLKRETSFEDDRTHLSNSSTKQTSFDSKSMASVTTFAMDEKDSLRPDDSASVQAADEEESLSGPASGAPNSLTGSESGARGLRDHLRDASLQKARGVVPGAAPRFNDGAIQISGAIPPGSVSNNFVLPNADSFQDGRSLHGFPSEPDEKLLEAMNSPKDRLLLLQLEEKIRIFIQDSKEQSLELPPSNAFGRLLAHKLGDYYHLTHFVDNNVTSVRLHRTPFCRLPTPLALLHAANTTPPPSAPAMKIMRRNGDRPGGSTGANSSAPSKTTSEAGGEGNDEERGGSSAGATPAKDRTTMTREEREAKYQEARERIFRDFPESKSSDNASGDQSAQMSRSSSASGRKKTHRQKTPHDDSFEARSQFNAYYPGMHYASGPVPYNVPMGDGSYTGQPPYMVGPGASPSMGYVQNAQHNAMYSAPMNMNSVPHYPMTVSPHMAQNNGWQNGALPQGSPYSGYASINQPSAMMAQQSSTRSSPAMNNYAVPNTAQYQQTAPSWMPTPYQSSFQHSPQRNPPPVHWPNYPSQSMVSGPVTYPYGQLPAQPYGPGMQNHANQHPLPGSFTRSPFNPQTRSFVPGAGSPMGYPGKGNQHGMGHSYGGPQPGNQQQWGGSQSPASNYAAGRNGSSSSQDSIAKWGTPSHLPPKPPPSEVSSDFDMKNRITSVPNNNGLPNMKNGPLVVSGGSKQN
ncbi:hypothetical protein DTO195F2_3485 [Paecilomyces variotii]|nr:hypothetical protein DTO195F2_3485 [Paecilomyces variotii]